MHFAVCVSLIEMMDARWSKLLLSNCCQMGIVLLLTSR